MLSTYGGDSSSQTRPFPLPAEAALTLLLKLRS